MTELSEADNQRLYDLEKASLEIGDRRDILSDLALHDDLAQRTGSRRRWCRSNRLTSCWTRHSAPSITGWWVKA